MAIVGAFSKYCEIIREISLTALTSRHHRIVSRSQTHSLDHHSNSRIEQHCLRRNHRRH